MKDENIPESHLGQSMIDPVKNWMMVALTLIFVLLYAAALLGMIKPLSDQSVIFRVESIIFVIIGYYFGRLPAQATENSLKNEISRQTQKADAAQHIKERALQERDILEEKIRNAKLSLVPFKNNSAFITQNSAAIATEPQFDERNQTIETAFRILDS